MSHAAAPLSAPPALVAQLLDWIAERPRTYAETMEAWRTSCPRLPVWEDALDARLIEVGRSAGSGSDRPVRLTAAGTSAPRQG